MKSKREKADWPRTVTVGNASVIVYRRERRADLVRFRVVFIDTDGTRKEEMRTDEAEAIELAEQKAGILSTFGARVAAAPSKDFAEFVRLGDLLKPHGVSVTAAVEAVEGWLRSHSTLDGIAIALTEQRASGVSTADSTAKPVPEAVKDFIAAHKAHGETSELHIADLESRLGRFAEKFSCDVHTLTTADLQAWLNGCNGGVANYEHNRRVLSAFFGWCYCQRFHTDNIAATPKKAARVAGKNYLLKRTVPVSKKQVFTPDEMRKLIRQAEVTQKKAETALRAGNADKQGDLAILPCLLLSGFAGLRTSEVLRVKWSDVDFENGRMIVGEDGGKTSGSWRSLVMSPNLKSALQQFKGRKGFVWTNRGKQLMGTFNRFCGAQRRVAKAAGMAWKQNAPRHSYISYRLLRQDPIERVAADAGNSPAIINRNYKSLRFADGSFITEKHAADWFAIM